MKVHWNDGEQVYVQQVRSRLPGKWRIELLKRMTKVSLTLGFSALAGVAWLIGAPDSIRAQTPPPTSEESQRIAIGYHVAPVPLTIGRRDPNLVGLGSYLVNNFGGCNDCHTANPFAQGGNPYLGQPKVVNAAQYLGGGQFFGPFLVSPNLSPDASGLPGGMTYQKFYMAIRLGQDPANPSRILQVMPWPGFQGMSDHDLLAIYTYLQSIPPVHYTQAGAPVKNSSAKQ